MYSEFPEKAVIFFKQSDCHRCKEVDYFIKQFDLCVPLIEIDKDEQPEYAEYFAITAVPLVLVISEGEEVERIFGIRRLQSLEEIVSEI